MGDHKTVGLFGLGAMGYGMAQSLLRAGHAVHGADLNTDAVARLQSEGGADGTPHTVAAQLDAVVIVVLNATQTEDVLFGEHGIAPFLRKGALVMSCATVAPDFARDMAARCEALDLHYLDAPISGGMARAAAGDLAIMASGTPEAFTAADAVLKATASTVHHMGDAVGAGSAMKAVNQILAGVHIATMAEAMTFGMTQGIDPARFMEVIPQCAGTSFMLENRGPHIVDGDYTPTSSVNIWPKDLGIVLDIAKGARFPAPITGIALQQFVAAAGMGHGHEDDAAVAKVYARASGLTLPGEET
ncbi:L-threonate dehydrogenase [Gymnodinialimonas hymeniacidonis]|uniref:L-threonate dehydrogenase n=1 Tax=Gymnodinialimonas hymeniacidonis TaxID=3126508 RepID=UPI0034C604A6